MPRLKEQPREWQKFTGVISLAATFVSWSLGGRMLPARAWVLVAGLGALAVGASLVRPQWFRGFYRAGMTVSHHVGQAMGAVMLTVVFFLVVTPLGLLLRVLGKDLLDLRPREAASYFRKADFSDRFNNMF